MNVLGFDRHLRAVLTRAEEEARADGSAAVDAHHLLLALAAGPGPAGAVLAGAGLDRAGVRAALDREFTHSLAAAGVAASAFGLPPATPDPHRHPQLGASFRLAMERAAAVAGGAAPRPGHLLLGILQADAGTVPRALALAGADRDELAARVRQAMAAAS